MTLPELRALIGDTATDTLCERLGGTTVYVSAIPATGSRLVLAIGRAAAVKICNAMSGEYLDIPSRLVRERDRRRAAVIYDLARGLSPPEVAVRHGLTVRHIRNIRESA